MLKLNVTTTTAGVSKMGRTCSLCSMIAQHIVRLGDIETPCCHGHHDGVVKTLEATAKRMRDVESVASGPTAAVVERLCDGKGWVS